MIEAALMVLAAFAISAISQWFYENFEEGQD